MSKYILIGLLSVIFFVLIILTVPHEIYNNNNNKINEKLKKLGFTINKDVKVNRKTGIIFDNNKKQFLLKQVSFQKELQYNAFQYTQVLSFELVENGNTTYETKVEGGITRAIIGGAMFGGVGAIVGANTARQNTTSATTNTYQIRLTINDFNNPNIIVDCKDKKTAQEIYSTFEVIKYNN